MTPKPLLLLLLMAFFAPWAAQAQQELTVYDGTATNNVIPAYILYFDDFTRSQFVIPAADLAEMSGGTIASLSFYTTSSNVPYTTVSTADVYLMEVDYTTMDGLEPKANGTIVYQGYFDIVSEGNGGKLTIDFDTPYTYNGGNLLVGIENTTDVNYKNIYFYGQSITGTAWGGSNSSSLESVTGSTRSFIPKTTFTYFPEGVTYCDRPSTVYVQGAPTESYADIHWTDGSGVYNVEYRKASDANWTPRVRNYQAHGLMLTNLSANTKYMVRVQSVCDDGSTSAWKTMNFSTLCGFPFFEPFATNGIPAGWNGYYGLLSNVMAGTVSLTSANFRWNVSQTDGVFDTHAYFNIYYTYNGWFVTPPVTLQDNCRLSFDLALTKYGGTQLPVTAGEQPDDRFVVLASTDGGTTWTILREWNNTGSSYVYDDIATTGEHVSIDLSSYNNGTIQIAFYGESTVSNGDNNLHIDNVTIATATTPTFVNDGNWNDGSCWSTGTVPAPGSDVIIMANAVIPADYYVVANKITIAGNGSLTIADGGKLKHNTGGLVVTMKKNIVPYTNVNGTDNYYLLSFPFDMSVAVPEAMTAIEGYDFYTFDPNYQDAEWRNNRQQTITTVGGVSLSGGDSGTTGYLYASPQAMELSLTGVSCISGTNSFSYINQVTVPYDEESTLPSNGWALLGNPFTCNAYLYYFDESNGQRVPMEFMVYDEQGEMVTHTCGPIAPMQGFFVKVTETTTVFMASKILATAPFSVDLGLPSGTLWAACNVGAGAPEDYGDYFAWGETQPKNTYSWSSYQYCDGSSTTLTKYCNNSSYGFNGYTDDLTTLLPEDDAATANWGNGWRMPTDEEWQELIDNTTITSVTQDGVVGKLFTAPNGNSLFLPAAGYKTGNNHYNLGIGGNYWSAMLDTDNPSLAYRFYYNNTIDYNTGYNFRNNGRSVRPVRNICHITVTSHSDNGGTVTGAGTFFFGQSCTVTAMPNEGYVFLHWTEDGEVVSTDATYTFTVEGNRNLVAYFAQFIGDHAYVDLGLPSGIMWATTNLGANAPEDYGDYFAWGETQPKTNYDWSNYQHCNGSYNAITKYCNNSYYGYNGYTDNLTTLLFEDDAATTNWGEDWRMPTVEEWSELYANTTRTEATLNGVAGRRFTAANGNSIFLPYSGYRYESTLSNAGSNGYYWSSMLNSSKQSQARSFQFASSGSTTQYIVSRCPGLSVRAVLAEQTPTESYMVTATATPKTYGKVTNTQQGTTCTLTATPNEGYVFVNWTEDGEVVSTDATYTFTVESNRNLVANFAPTGAINGKFSVSGSKQVYFSMGNLQYKASTNTWRFAPYQYSYIGSANANMSSTYNDWIDLFGWGTSGYNHGAVCYQPWSTSINSDYYYAYGSANYNLNDQTGQADWGYNAISNGGNIVNQWRTLTEFEWNYVLNTRSTDSGKRYAKAIVNGVNGVILLPDNWSTSYYSLNCTNEIGASFSNNVITSSQWNNSLQNHGAVFLPVAGYRYNGTEYVEDGWAGYWTATHSNTGAYTLDFNDSNLVVRLYTRSAGESVRLVRDAQAPTHSYVDLGLSSGILWATCNVGANAPEEYGDHFAWGETTPKTTFSWSNYQHCNGDESTLTKYCKNSDYGYNGYTDNLTTLLPEDDAATANWGSDWRMPTFDDFVELYFEIPYTWTTQNGVEGALFTSNGNSLFLPGNICRYWLSDVFSNDPNKAEYFYCENDDFDESTSLRYNGYSVRPVRSTSPVATQYTITATPSPAAGGTIINTQSGQSCTVRAFANSGYVFLNWTENGNVVSTNATYTFTMEGNRNLVANFATHEYVDLGLPSGLLWATCNVGAATPEGYGDYFAWGETQPKTNYDWSNYQHCNGDYNQLTKYCSRSGFGYNGFTDYLTTLLPEDDAATANWGNGWRMPTQEEWDELLDNTTSVWTTRNGVNGRLFTASNGNSLFLPAAGYRASSSLYKAGSDGYYWLSSINWNYPDEAWLFYFYSDSYFWGYLDRDWGQSVRPVRSSGQN